MVRLLHRWARNGRGGIQVAGKNTSAMQEATALWSEGQREGRRQITPSLLLV
jgi:hypothetical protein